MALRRIFGLLFYFAAALAAPAQSIQLQGEDQHTERRQISRRAELLFDQNPHRAFAYLDSVERHSSESQQHLLRADVKTILARFKEHQGHFMQALQLSQDAIAILKKHNGRDPMRGYQVIAVGNILYKLRHYREAMEFYRRAHEYFQLTVEDSENYGESVALNNIGLCHRQLGQTDSAVFYLKKGLALREKTGRAEGILYNYYELASLHQEANEPSEARRYINRGLTEFAADSTSLWYLSLRWMRLVFDASDAPSAEKRRQLGQLRAAILNEHRHPDFFQHQMNRDLVRLAVDARQYAQAETLIQQGLEDALAHRNFPAAIAMENRRKKNRAGAQQPDPPPCAPKSG